MLSLQMSSTGSEFALHKRPKLSLQTNSLPPNFSRTSSSFPIMTLPTTAATPTTFNTFNNTYDLTHRPTPASILASKTSSRLVRSQSPRPMRRNDRPYHLPFGIKPILKSSEPAGYATASPSTGTRKVFFPQAKKVSFKVQLEEEIVNHVYTARHSDLVWENDEDVMESIEQDSECALSIEDTQNPSTSLTTRRMPNCISLGVKETKTLTRKIMAPVQSRKKRRWEWTLSPVKTKFEEEDTDFSDLDSDWVVVSIDRERSQQSSTNTARPAKRRAASLDAENKSMVKRRLIRNPVRSNTL